MNMTDITGTIDAATAAPYDQLKIAIVGPSKGGKSRLAVTAPKPCLVYDFDARAASIAGTPGVFIKTLVDSQPLNPKAYNDLYVDIGQFEYEKSQGRELPFKTIVVDSMTYASAAAMNHVMNTMSNDKSVKSITIGSYTMRIPRGFDPYVAETDLMINTVLRLFGLGVNVICVFHERPEEMPESTAENPKFSGKFTVNPPRMSKLLPLFNELWRVTPEGGVYQVQTKPDYRFTGATCLNIDSTESPNIEAMITKHKQKAK